MATKSPIGVSGVSGERLERRRTKSPHQPPIEALRQMPALVVLQRLPVPALAVDRTGSILFANNGFCDMLGYPADELMSMMYDDIFDSLPSDDGWIALLGTSSERLVELRHKYGHIVFASMSKSAMRRRDDAVALVTFCDRTEELWVTS